MLNYNTRGVDGIFGPGSRGAITNWQQSNGYPQTSYLTVDQIDLMEAQTAAATLVKGQDEYALELVDPATRSYDRYSPARKRMVVVATFAAGFFVTGIIVLVDILRQVKSRLDVYSAGHGRKPVRERPWSLRGILLRLLDVLTQPFRQLSDESGGKK